MTLVANRPTNGPGLHAFVVGVGHYPSMPEPAGPAARSALAFTRWLSEKSGYNNPTCPLATIELLVSSKAAMQWGGAAVEPANRDNIETRGAEWLKRAGSHEDNIALLYFAGHGVERGLETALLLEGFNPQSASPFSHAINFTEFLGGMESCAARKQVFVVDACRETPSWVIGFPGALGDGKIAARNLFDRPSMRARDYAVWMAAAADQKAWAPPDGQNFFTTALLRALSGPAADDRSSDDGTFEVRPEFVASSIARLTELGVVEFPVGPQQPQLTGHFSTFVFHVPAPMVVPVRIGCEDAAQTSSAAFEVKSATFDPQRSDPPRDRDWIVDVAPTDATVSVKLASGASSSKSLRVAPPARRVRF
ncbi:MAG: caspase family protein [Polyangiaceae bacterium]|nr:caspase family protein [Polyangiaceae bacterium]